MIHPVAQEDSKGGARREGAEGERGEEEETEGEVRAEEEKEERSGTEGGLIQANLL